MNEIETLQLQLTTTQKQSEKDKQENREINIMVSSRKSAQSTAHSHAPPSWHKDLKYLAKLVIPGRKTDLPL